jgi:hypothetical protein
LRRIRDGFVYVVQGPVCDGGPYLRHNQAIGCTERQRSDQRTLAIIRLARSVARYAQIVYFVAERDHGGNVWRCHCAAERRRT